MFQQSSRCSLIYSLIFLLANTNANGPFYAEEKDKYVVCEGLNLLPLYIQSPIWPSSPFYLFLNPLLLARLFQHYCPNEISKVISLFLKD